MRKLEVGEGVLVGFAGGVADALALLERFEERLKEAKGNLLKGAVETAKLWRTDRVLRHLQAMIVAADRESMVLLSGSGEVITPEEPLLAVGSGGLMPSPPPRPFTGTRGFPPRRSPRRP